MTYTPDNWVIVKITRPEGVVHKVLAGWSGGYLDGDHWRMNSGIVSAREEGEYILFHGQSGSVYKCHEDAQRLSNVTAGIFNTLVNQGKQKGVTVEIVDMEPSWYVDAGPMRPTMEGI
jgi:hypothetical protein